MSSGNFVNFATTNHRATDSAVFTTSPLSTDENYYGKGLSFRRVLKNSRLTVEVILYVGKQDIGPILDWVTVRQKIDAILRCVLCVELTVNQWAAPVASIEDPLTGLDGSAGLGEVC